MSPQPPAPPDAAEALRRLREGNRRFVAHEPGAESFEARLRRAEMVAGQSPFAIVLGCADSRVPAEIVFDQGPGTLFVVRVAGNIVAPSQVGSVEFAAERFGTRLVVVLGHSQCGAVEATIDAIRNPDPAASKNLMSIVERIRPAVRPLVEAYVGADPGDLLDRAVRANIAAGVSHLRHGSELLERLIQDDGLQVVGAEYGLASGAVEFLPD